MARNLFRTVLVVGDNHEEIIRKYSADTQVESHVIYRRADAGKMRSKHIKICESMLKCKDIVLTNNQKEIYKNMYIELKDMSDDEYWDFRTNGCTYDEKTGDAYTTENDNAYYRSEKCYDHRLKKYGDEGPFSNPFKLKDGTLAYSARFNDIDWTLNHMYGTELYGRAWDLIVDNDDPKTEQEEGIKERMANRIAYFENFTDRDEYIRHSCSFWTYGVAYEDKYVEIDYTISDKRWVAEFFDRFIKPLEKENPLLTIYEVRSNND